MHFMTIIALILGLTSSSPASAPMRDDFVPDEKEEGCSCVVERRCGSLGSCKVDYGRKRNADECRSEARVNNILARERGCSVIFVSCR